MNPRLRSLLVAVGVATAGGVAVVVSQVQPGVTRGELVDAGMLEDCAPVNVACPVVYCDGGECAEGFVARRGAWCAASNDLILPDLPRGAQWFAVSRCRRITLAEGVLAEGVEQPQPFDCACSKGPLCLVGNPDGGIALTAPTGETLGPGYRFSSFTGTDCVPKACVTLAGARDNSWPAACPSR